ncbi:MAG: hypothetical protein ERJ67_00790 [Aphanocapsa feldmannii 277cV]|uniref:Uncharacterized protein n=1 Tax=Aphanocapsa feldmannii 277cV TaxID=2507553 RepID=A0A524RR05_9CHRO|nr:MAG: hypothetical protein ERJ67_00790 [Aphanocapsa feldmannii 277cV]
MTEPADSLKQKDQDLSLEKYRDLLLEYERESQTKYDRLVATLSAGAFGVSFSFIDRIAGDNPAIPWTMIVAWSLWAVSLLCVLCSHQQSTMALGHAIKELDEKRELDPATAGGCAGRLTGIMNCMSGAAFIGGLIFVCIFTSANFGR